MNARTWTRLWLATLHLAAWGSLSAADQWPTYRADNHRSGVSPEALTTPLFPQWTFQPRQPPRRAWPRTFRENAWTQTKMRSLLTFDHAYHAICAVGNVYFGSSADHQITCLDARTGQIRWSFFTEGPVRMAPTFANGKVYAGSDDGRIYCLDANSGKLVFRRRVGPNNDRLPGNEQWISRWPIRSGVVVRDNVAYCAAGLFPHREGSYLCGVDADTGEPVLEQRINQVTQGYLLASESRLYVPAGKLAPSVYDRQTGKFVSKVDAPRGAFALLSDDVLFAGPSVSGGELGAVTESEASDQLATFPGNEMIVDEDVIYLLTDEDLRAVSRQPLLLQKLERRQGQLEAALQEADGGQDREPVQAELDNVLQQIVNLEAQPPVENTWTRESSFRYSLIKAAEHLFVGGDDEVAAIRAADGETIWTAEVDGRALGLSVADGQLIVSTDSGAIHCFGPTSKPATATEAPPAAVDPYSESEFQTAYVRAAEQIVAAAPQDKGYCLVLDSGLGQLAYEIARQSELYVVAVESDPQLAEEARRRLDRGGLYGTRIVVHEAATDALPYEAMLFNLVVSDRAVRGAGLPPAAEVARVLRPYGLAMIGQPTKPAGQETSRDDLRAWCDQTQLDGAQVTEDNGRWAKIHRKPIPGGGQWTHQYGNASNTACSEDTLVSSNLRLHWFGRPGPYRMFDRHSFTAAPVAVGGRLFTLGERVLYGQDAYNGTLLWTAELPELAPRVNLPRDCGFMAADQSEVLVAAGAECLRLDGASGRRLPAYALPESQSADLFDWGYLAIQDDLLLGSAVRKGQFYSEGRGPWYDDSSLGGAEHSVKVLSEGLFAIDRTSGNFRWRYPGVVVNSTVAAGAGRLYFVENRHPDIVADSTGLPDGEERWKDLILVALDVATGDKLWEAPLHYDSRDVVFYLAYKDGVLVSVRSSSHFEIAARDAATGKQIWEKSHGWLRTHHGSHRRHPVIVGDVVFQQPQSYDLKTGEPRWQLSENGACGTLSAAGSVMFCRVNYPRLYDLSNQGKPDNLVEVTRPGCWINIIAAGGLVLMPEAGSGCSCDFPLHATMAFLPK